MSQQSAFCHSCQQTFTVLESVNDDPTCPLCQGDFVEFLERVEESQDQQNTANNQQWGNTSNNIFSGMGGMGGMPFFGFNNMNQGGGPQTFSRTFHFSTLGGAGPSSATTQQQSSGTSGTGSQNQQQQPQNMDELLQGFMRAFMPPQQQNQNEDDDADSDDMDNDDTFNNPQTGFFANFMRNIMNGGNGGQFTFNMDGGPQQGYQMGDYFMGGMDDIITRLMEQFDGPVGEPPASEKALAKVNEKTISQEDVEQQLECSVCLDGFKLEERVKEMPECHHKFHEDCLMPWLKEHNACPVCRQGIDDPDRKEQEKKHRRSGQSQGDNNNDNPFGNGGGNSNDRRDNNDNNGAGSTGWNASSFMNMFA
mmetsp:Transcript_11397/g.42800  ORF Transcript_11397/g.42800 Transcript_11397/m.42800 type:complete len:365 (-) Transcript_11397:174-1268(-)|eukprot:CAMPEP_0117448202 /NCGR_PEP_ID=MMETSP0759-20121206/7277_1 /TAXON_ID=63605 /ORGANISM="Percolomonas cosmopolitus, Strain WS" /LENGTH=364 /DNA_ID=CAMNT_0005240577 /DNA_START=346 /DNA_END=1440 /DNA_ORIENTATION=+